MNRSVASPLLLASALLSTACTSVAVPQGTDGGGSPAIQVSASSLTFVATASGGDPASQFVSVGSAGTRTLAAPTVSVTYLEGSAWLSVAVEGDAVPYVVLVQPVTAGLAAGTYRATVSIDCPGASNSPVSVPVTLTVSPPPPVMAVAPASLSFTATEGGSSPGAQSLTVTSGNAGTLAVPSAAVSLATGSGWLTASVSGTSAPFTVTVTAAPGGLAPGTYQGTVSIASAGAANTPVGVPVTLTVDPAPRAGAYEVSLLFVNPPTAAQGLAFQRARERVEQVVTGDVPDVAIDLTGAQLADCGGVPVHEIVDDLLVVVLLEPIDGAGATLGQAGPCVLRGAGAAPVLGLMRFDTADLAMLEASGRLDAVVLHEMLHVMGFGTLWSAPLLVGAGGADPIFTGAGALDAFVSFNNGGTYAGAKVPVENSGGAGTRDSHWRDSVFRNELMTGYISGATQPLSRTTAAALADQGYAVDLAASDPFDIATAGLRLAGEAPEVALGDDVLRIPLQVMEADGTVRPLR